MEKRKTVRQHRDEQRSVAAFLFIIVFEAVVIFSLLFALRVNHNKLKVLAESVVDAEPEPVVVEKDMSRAMDSMSRIYTNDGTPIDLYVTTDPDTGSQYVVTSTGDICPRQ